MDLNQKEMAVLRDRNEKHLALAKRIDRQEQSRGYPTATEWKLILDNAR